ncbi:acyl-CoA dehydrogenase family protein [Streptomyces abyssalis]|uniref:acyl-CoA dehydrogenase family protein n=1 Tax=Streptomyces abyssalis TaxID=933944 RepID=UPI00099FB460
MRTMGGYGYAIEYDMERQLRTAVVFTVRRGTIEIQRDIIGRTFGPRPAARGGPAVPG